MRARILWSFVALSALPAAAKKHPPRRHEVSAPKPEPARPTPPPTETPAPVPDPPKVEAPPPPKAEAPPPREEPPPPPPASGDLEGLRGEYDAIRDELFRSRARIGVVGEAVFKTKLIVDVDYRAQRDWPLKRLTLQLDDKQVYAEDNPQAGKTIRSYDSFAGAGRHVIAVAVESAGPEARAGYGATGLFIVDVVDGKTTHVTLTADESGDGPEKLAKKREGSYDVRLKAAVRSEPLPAGIR